MHYQYIECNINTLPCTTSDCGGVTPPQSQCCHVAEHRSLAPPRARQVKCCKCTLWDGLANTMTLPKVRHYQNSIERPI